MNWQQLLSYKRLNSEHKFNVQSIHQQSRSEFEVDVDRIVFSYPFRRLQDKTQVVPLPEHDFVHTRLTHSLEVSSVGRSLGKKTGAAILLKRPELKETGYSENDFGSIVAAACLTHDIGNPPFGHSGEKALSEFFIAHRPQGLTDLQYADLTNFEGNAQGFRILCSPHYNDLKLTYATLATFSKYPCESILSNRDKSRKSQKKFGYYQSEKKHFAKIANECGMLSLSDSEGVWSRHPLTFLVEAADDICYLIIDLEDAARMGVISFNQFKEMVSPIIGNKLDEKKLNEIRDPNQRIGILRAMAIQHLVDQCAEKFIEEEEAILKGTFDQALSDLISSAVYTEHIARYSFQHIYNAPQVLEIQAAGFEVLPGLLEICWEAMEDHLIHGKKCKAKHLNLLRMLPFTCYDLENPQRDAYLRARDLCDFISGMTDRYAVALYKKIKGISI
jgi:dGTPase